MMSAISGAFLFQRYFQPLCLYGGAVNRFIYPCSALWQSGSFLAGINYLLISGIGLILFLFGIGVLYRYSGTLNMLDISEKIPEFFSESPRAFILTLALFIVAVRNKMYGNAPLHTWLPDAHSIAPSPVSALLSGIVIKVGIYAFFRTVQMFRLCPFKESLYMFWSIPEQLQRFLERSWPWPSKT